MENQPIPCPECDNIKYFEGLCNPCRNRKRSEYYIRMSKEEVAKTIQEIILDIENGNDFDEKFWNLLAYHNINTKEIADTALKKNVFYPRELYKDASEEVQNQLIEMILNPQCEEANHILCCLAVIGSEKVQKTFYHLENNPLPWRKNLYVNPSIYAECAGWTFDKNGKRIEFNYPKCYSIEERNEEDNALKVCEKIEGNCSVCGCGLVNILILDGNDKRLSFLGIKEEVQLPICPNCASMSDKVIIQYAKNGKSTFEIIEPFGENNYISEEEYEELISNNLKLSLTEKLPYHARAYYDDEISIIGGNPDWVQDWQYEKCPDCQQKMKLLSAISWEQILSGSEGILYIEICTDCSVAVAFHQQT